MRSNTSDQSFGNGEVGPDHPTKPRCTLLLSLPPLPSTVHRTALAEVLLANLSPVSSRAMLARRLNPTCLAAGSKGPSIAEG